MISPIEEYVPDLDGMIAALAVVTGLFLFFLVRRVHVVRAFVGFFGGIAVALVAAAAMVFVLVRGLVVGRDRRRGVLVALLVRLLRQFAPFFLRLYRQYPPVGVFVHRRRFCLQHGHGKTFVNNASKNRRDKKGI